MHLYSKKIVTKVRMGFKIWSQVGGGGTQFLKLPYVREFLNIWFQTLQFFVWLRRYFIKSSKSFCQCENIVVLEKQKSCTWAKNGYCADGRVDGHQIHAKPTMSLRGSVANIKCEARRAELCSRTGVDTLKIWTWNRLILSNVLFTDAFDGLLKVSFNFLLTLYAYRTYIYVLI